MNYVNYDDAIAQIRAYGLQIDEAKLAFDARIQRWRVEGEDAEKRGWTRLRDWTSAAGHAYIVGSFGVWRGNDDGKVKIELPQRDRADRPAVTAEDLAAMRAAQKEADRKLADVRKAEARRAATWAALVWSRCAAAESHEYLERKGVKPHGARVLGPVADVDLPEIDKGNRWRLDQAVGALVVPMHDAHGNVCGVQLIYPKGHPRREKTDKEFWPSGMAMGGTFGVIGHLRRDGVILVAEGFATAATLHEATGQSVLYAFAAGNLAKAGKEIRKTMPGARLLFCADDDYLSDGNPGVTAATRACAELERAAWLAPDFADESGVDRRGGAKLTDFNDLAAMTGLPVVVANQINAKLDALDWRDPLPVAVGSPRPGGGGNGRRAARSVMRLDDVVDRFVPLDDGTGKYVFDTWTNKVAHRDQVTALLPAGMRGDDLKRHPVWVERGAYYLDEVGFDPAGQDARCKLNTWQGWPMEPKPGKCDAILETLRYLCNNEGSAKGEEVYRWLLCWMAYPLQHPGAKMNSAVIMHGPQGTGKSMVFQALAKIYGDYSTVLNQRGLEDKFNSDWSDSKLFILAEEVVTRAEMWHIKNELKELVTGEWIRINPKNIAAYRQRNHVNIAYLSNENQPLPIENDDRRHLVIYTPPALDENYYDDAWGEVENGGVAAFYDYLLRLDLSEFHPKKRPPMTEAKQRLMALSSPSEVRFVTEWVTGELGLPVCPALSGDVYAAYKRWCNLNGEVRPRPSNHFFGAIQHMPGWSKVKSRIFPTPQSIETVPKPLVVPPESAIAADGRAQNPGTMQARWLTDCVAAFAAAIAEDGKAWATG